MLRAVATIGIATAWGGGVGAISAGVGSAVTDSFSWRAVGFGAAAGATAGMITGVVSYFSKDDDGETTFRGSTGTGPAAPAGG